MIQRIGRPGTGRNKLKPPPGQRLVRISGVSISGNGEAIPSVVLTTEILKKIGATEDQLNDPDTYLRGKILFGKTELIYDFPENGRIGASFSRIELNVRVGEFGQNRLFHGEKIEEDDLILPGVYESFVNPFVFPLDRETQQITDVFLREDSTSGGANIVNSVKIVYDLTIIGKIEVFD